MTARRDGFESRCHKLRGIPATFSSAILAALGAAMCFAIAAVFQQESAQLVEEDKSLSVGLLTDLVHRPRWLAGGAFLLAGYGLQAVGLAFGPIALVQPIVVLELAFAIPLWIWRKHRHSSWREWAGIVCVVGGIALFLLIASPAGGSPTAPAGEWVASLVPVGGVAFVAVALGARSKGPHKAMLFGTAAGLAFGVLSVLTKATTYLLSRDVTGAFLNGQPYAAIGVGIVAHVVSQSAYQAGPLSYSMPFVGVLEPTVAVIIGDIVLREQIELSAGLLAAECLAAVIAALGIVLLTASPIVHSIYEQTGHPAGGARPAESLGGGAGG
ncbi:MAG: DMT family transporter [Acidimicrobiales bacterium]